MHDSVVFLADPRIPSPQIAWRTLPKNWVHIVRTKRRKVSNRLIERWLPNLLLTGSILLCYATVLVDIQAHGPGIIGHGLLTKQELPLPEFPLSVLLVNSESRLLCADHDDLGREEE